MFELDAFGNEVRKDKDPLEERRFNRPTRFGANIPEGWISTPEYIGAERRSGEQRTGLERRTFSRLGDGRVPRRKTRGRRFDEIHGLQYRGLVDRP